MWARQDKTEQITVMINDILEPRENLGKTPILHNLHGNEKTGKTGQNWAKLGKAL